MSSTFLNPPPALFPPFLRWTTPAPILGSPTSNEASLIECERYDEALWAFDWVSEEASMSSSSELMLLLPSLPPPSS